MNLYRRRGGGGERGGGDCAYPLRPRRGNQERQINQQVRSVNIKSKRKSQNKLVGRLYG